LLVLLLAGLVIVAHAAFLSPGGHAAPPVPAPTLPFPHPRSRRRPLIATMSPLRQLAAVLRFGLPMRFGPAQPRMASGETRPASSSVVGRRDERIGSTSWRSLVRAQ